jgi:uncharacterized protein (DUF305 family)
MTITDYLLMALLMIQQIKTVMKKEHFYSIFSGCCILMFASFNVFCQNDGLQKESTINPQTDSANYKPQNDANTNDADSNVNLGTGTAGGLSTSSTSEIENLRSIANNNMETMMNSKLSGQVDEDFATLMAAHHNGAIEMSKAYIQTARDNNLKNLAEKSMDKMKMDIEKLNAFAEKHDVKSKDESGSKELLESMHQMRSDQSMEGSLDQQFARLMIDHHKAGIDMADVEINKGTHSDLKAMAKKLKEDQKKEIQDLQSWLNQNK